MNSTIVGQRKPKPNRHKKKKKHSIDDRERRYSEGEASDYESKTDSCDDCKQKSTTNNNSNGGKNGPAVQPKVNAKAGRVVDKQTQGPDIDKTAHLEFKNGLMFDIEI